MRNEKNLIPMLAILMAVAFLLGMFSSSYFLKNRYVVTLYNVKEVARDNSSAEIFLPAIDNDGNGVVLKLSVFAKPGNNEILTNIDKLLFWTDTQQSIQIARDIAKNFTNTCCFDIVYKIDDTNATVVGGPSAGAAFAIATISAFSGKELNKSVAITGTINPDGSIGQVGGVKEKAEAAKKHGIKLFLVPEGQSVEKRLKPVEKCIERESFSYCEIRYKEVETNISEAVGIDIREVKNINEAAKYFFSD